MEEEIKHEPHYLMITFSIIFIIVVFFVSWHIVMDVETDYITGTIIDVIYKDNGFAGDSVFVLFANVTQYGKNSLDIDFDANTYYNNQGSNLTAIYLLLREHISDRCEIEYTHAIIGDIGFKSLTCR